MTDAFLETLEIAAPPERVWAVMSAVESWPSWTPTVTSVEPLSRGAAGPGARYRLRQPKLLPAVWEVTSWEPGRGFVWVSRNPGATAVGEHLVEPCAAGSRVTLRVRFEGFLAPLVARLAGRLTREYMSLEARGLKAAVERR